MASSTQRPFRALAISGGGMRGLHATAYLSSLARRFSATRDTGELDIGKGFDLIAGTSTGAIIACALAHGVSLRHIVRLYRESGPLIFPKPVPTRCYARLLGQLFSRRRSLRSGDAALRRALRNVFADTTIIDIWRARHVALAIPAVDMSSHAPWVFKTPHAPNTYRRDDDYSIVDVCRASTAAPIYRSLARVDNPDTPGSRVFADGGLWANNPALVALVDAVQTATPHQPIEVFALGTSPPPKGDVSSSLPLAAGFLWWKFGARAATLALDAEDRASAQIARLLAPHLSSTCRVIRFPHSPVPANKARFFELDSTSPRACSAMINHAEDDVSLTLSACSDPNDCNGARIATLFDSMPPFPSTNSESASD